MIRRRGHLAKGFDELSRMVPEAFAEAYQRVWDEAYRDGGIDASGGGHPLSGAAGALGKEGGTGVDSGRLAGGWRINSGKEDLVGKSSGPGKSSSKAVGKTSRTLKSEKAFKLKARLDKRLRKMAREIMAELDGRSVKAAGHRVCAGKCKKFGDYEWSYCPNCGGMMREVEEDE